jgi:hypothetical protein
MILPPPEGPMRSISLLCHARAAVLSGLTALAAVLGSGPSVAQERPNLMIVFDASGSMWGQIGGRTKIEMAREALSSVLSEVEPQMEVGLIAYGHRVRGQCSDIELVVPMGDAMRTVPQILNFTARVNPRGMTPLSDSVLMAAERMGYTEQAATVVLLTDGIETCAGDPCALGRMLAQQGIDFRAHVVGFDLTDAEQQQVSCLAEETGGLFLAANDADTLRDALARTLALEVMPEPAPAPAPEPDPQTLPRRVDLILRDVAGGPVLTGRPFRAMEFVPLDEGAEVTGRLDLSANPGPLTGRVELRPGRYTLITQRLTEGREPIRISLPVEVPAGTDAHTLDLVIAARLRLNVLLHAGRPMPEGNGRLPRAVAQGWSHADIHPVIDGAIDPAVNYGGINSRDVALPPGDYFLRVWLDQHFGREGLIRVAPGVTTEVDVDLGAGIVSVDLRDAGGAAIERYTVRVFDLDAAQPFLSGNGREQGAPMPLYLPEGIWRIEAVAERGDRRPAVGWVQIGPGQTQSLRLSPGQTLGSQADVPEAAQAQCLDTHRAHGCMVETVSPVDMVRHLGLNGLAVGTQTNPRYTGTWQTQGGMMVLVQDGRRVWGEVHVNGGIGLVWGHVAPDGLTLRGAMDRSSSPRGVMELRIDAHADRMQGFWDHRINRMGSTVSARRLSGAVPPLTRATGTEDDLRLTQAGDVWAPAASAEFAAFMAPAQAPADPDTGENLDAMQRFAPPLGFHGIWTTSHGRMELVVDGRTVRGLYRGNRPLFAEVSADGSRLRGIWLHENGRDWGTLALDLDADRTAFSGGWGRNLDADLRGGVWTGSRIGWLAASPGAATPPVQAAGDGWAAFMDPVRDADAPEPDGLDGRDFRGDMFDGSPAILPSGLAGFVPAQRYDLAHPDGRPAASLIFAEAVPGGQFNRYIPGFVWLREGWCGTGCPSEILPVGGPDPSAVVNPSERLNKGGVFPALDLSAQGIVAFQGDDSDWPRVRMQVHVLDQPYDDGIQLGENNARVLRSFGPFAGDVVQPATLDGWPQPDPGAAVEIGTITTLPPGVWGMTRARSNDEIAQMLAEGATDPALTAEFAQACAREPRVIHTDGLIAIRAFDARLAAAGQAPWSTDWFLRCDQSGPILDCRGYNRPLATNPDPDDPDYTVIGTLAMGAGTVFALDEGDGNAMVFRSCLGPDGFIDATEHAPSGRLIVEHIADREDGGESPAFDAQGHIVGSRGQIAQAAPAPAPPPAPAPIPAPTPATSDFIPPGIWISEAPWSDPIADPGTEAFRAQCFDTPEVVFPDGTIIGMTLHEGVTGPEYAVDWIDQCRPSGDATWPFACRGEDANVAAEVVSTSRLRIDGFGTRTVGISLLSEGETAPTSILLHACLRDDGTGIDLDGSAEGRALARTIAGLGRGPVPGAAGAAPPATKTTLPSRISAPAGMPTTLTPGIWHILPD